MADERGEARSRGELASKGERSAPTYPLLFKGLSWRLKRRVETRAANYHEATRARGRGWRHQSFASIAKVALSPLLTFGKVDFV